MQAKQLMEQFALIANAPQGIQRLREMILQWAVQGKLVPQDPTDEAAAVLLAKIQAEKERLIKQGTIKRQKPLPPIREDEKPFELPNGWIWEKVGNIFEVKRGASPRPKGDPKYFSNQPTPYHWIKISDLRKHGKNNILYGTDEYLTELGSSKSVLVEKGTLIITNSATIGIPIIMGVNGYIHDGFLAFPSFPHNYISQDFFLIALRALTSYLKRESRGLAQLNMNSNIMKEAPFGLPPYPEQKRIVAKVDALMALCDELEALQQKRAQLQLSTHHAVLESLANAQTPLDLQTAWQRLQAAMPLLFTQPQQIKGLRDTILQLAVRGKLVPQDPTDEPAAMLLAKISAEKERLIKQGTIKRQKPLPPIREDEKPFELPNGWEWVRFDAAALYSEAGWSPSCESRPRENDKWAVLKVSAVTWGVFKPEENKELPNSLEPRPEYEVKTGDFLISRANTAELVARAVIVPENTPKKLMLSDKIIRFVLASNVDKQFINLMNSSCFARAYYAAVAGGTSSSMKNVSREQIRKLVFGLPPLNEQKRIVAKVNSLMALCDELEARLQAARHTQEQFALAAVALS